MKAIKFIKADLSPLAKADKGSPLSHLEKIIYCKEFSKEWCEFLLDYHWRECCDEILIVELSGVVDYGDKLANKE